MDFIHHQLGHRQRGEIVEIHLDARANVRLLNSSQFAAYKAGRSFRTIQGQATSSPIRWQIPQNGQCHVAIDFGGYPGRVRSSVRVLPGSLPPLRSQQTSQLATIAENLAEEAPESGIDRAKAFDVFISHAGEDKEAVVRPLAGELVDRGVSVWFDEFGSVTASAGRSITASLEAVLGSSSSRSTSSPSPGPSTSSMGSSRASGAESRSSFPSGTRSLRMRSKTRARPLPTRSPLPPTSIRSRRSPTRLPQ